MVEMVNGRACVKVPVDTMACALARVNDNTGLLMVPTPAVISRGHVEGVPGVTGVKWRALPLWS